ncbi:DUF3761 domain-containing protein [Nocardia sp. NPDC051052]|uniref:DUF3761 domain-containing protein n=1 Tax=Nocardia sp. NPDC051052 TaxID=3364322 RepID=UPI003795F62E
MSHPAGGLLSIIGASVQSRLSGVGFLVGVSAFVVLVSGCSAQPASPSRTSQTISVTTSVSSTSHAPASQVSAPTTISALATTTTSTPIRTVAPAPTTVLVPLTTVALRPPPAQVPPAPAPLVAPPRASDPDLVCGAGSYVNSSGNCVHDPVQAPSAPAGASAQCSDGTYSFSQHRSGTCSGHGGVARWL